MPLPARGARQNEPVEPMQIDIAPEVDQQAVEDNFIIEAATIDLDVYASNYVGLTKLNRLLFVAKHCPALEIDALRIALNYVKHTFNVQLYQEIVQRLIEACNRHGDIEPPAVETTWVETTSKKSALKLEKLDTDLKNCKTNSIKESVRRGHDDLGDHYFECGDLNNALKCYSRARDYCTTTKHVVNMCWNVIKVSIHMGNWAHVLNYVNKAENTTEIAEKDKSAVRNMSTLTKLKCAAGLAELASKKYKSAARYFLQAQFDNTDCPELLSASNVAIYGGLCALASFDRQELQKKVLSSSSFKLFLELEPQLRDVLYKFHESQYAMCLKLLDDMKDNFMLDIYLAPHVNTLYSQIRKRALVQYFSPYLSADMSKMARAFNTSVSRLEDELSQLILDEQINARIDSHNKVLYAREVDHRSSTFSKALEMGKDYRKRTKALVLRAAILRNQIVVKSPPRDSTSTDVGVASGTR
ncbi:COP9 signalosome complex subunit 1 [Exaiptasia diaphana]|uniref:PCI domain-containing protein n=1 Tax=Exaiptasia diaphana TaxID=2652724 RepID=A0A913X7Q6_EXADI|nr:COP9 signalosome complex subunit 1 [Exaiptasia diaphana]KXJ28579.1 COP9 signalosome complex subunit 1 [Exaiptasia diaphana]